MVTILDGECRAAVERAIHIAELTLSGQMAELDAAKAIAGLGTIECLEYIQVGLDFVDTMGALWGLAPGAVGAADVLERLARHQSR